MSGGSYEYLCWKEVRDLLDAGETLEAMVARLRKQYPDAADATQAVLDRVRTALTEIEAAAEPLRKVWKEVEWCDSCDSGEEDVREAVARWREKARG